VLRGAPQRPHQAGAQTDDHQDARGARRSGTTGIAARIAVALRVLVMWASA
jgi:hypothetical protein